MSTLTATARTAPSGATTAASPSSVPGCAAA